MIFRIGRFFGIYEQNFHIVMFTLYVSYETSLAEVSISLPLL